MMYVNKILFFVSMAHDIKFSMVQKLDNQKMPMFLDAVKKIQQVYCHCCYKIIHLLIDGQFEPIHGDLASLRITLNTVPNDEHAPEVEWYICNPQGANPCHLQHPSFQTKPSRIIIEMVYAANLCSNMFPHPDSISQTTSPRAILTGHRIKYATHCQLEFGEYVQTHKEHDNSMQPQTIGAISLNHNCST